MEFIFTPVAPKVSLLEEIVYAKDQPEYLQLPVSRTPDHNEVVTCWKLNFWARLAILFTGKFYLTILIFKKPLSPVRFSITKPIYVKK